MFYFVGNVVEFLDFDFIVELFEEGVNIDLDVICVGKLVVIKILIR